MEICFIIDSIDIFLSIVGIIVYLGIGLFTSTYMKTDKNKEDEPIDFARTFYWPVLLAGYVVRTSISILVCLYFDLKLIGRKIGKVFEYRPSGMTPKANLRLIEPEDNPKL